MPLLLSSKPREEVCFAFQHPFWAGSKTAYLKEMCFREMQGCRTWCSQEVEIWSRLFPSTSPPPLHPSPSIPHGCSLACPSTSTHHEHARCRWSCGAQHLGSVETSSSQCLEPRQSHPSSEGFGQPLRKQTPISRKTYVLFCPGPRQAGQ